ncbi:1,4-dihydroxy-2-naphthoate polyprenyltransferase [Lapillicoccus sp.]|uniref:1,4-dihydroxy-2-naphthoate polyprenyltransferase n=1 Tax=Lapillicoccus sp. TaxID=1909287 RepID=UPI00326607FE
MATFSQWVQGGRPRTLPVAVSPVAVGTGAAYALGQTIWGYALLALVVSLCLQVGVNYANDYSDGIRGTDTVRVGPVRLVGQDLANPSDVRLAALLAFFLAGLCGFALVALSQAWLMLPVGAACVLAAWYYTGGRHPYGYLGLGEVFVFVFFGLVATLGTLYTQALTLSWAGVLGAVGVGALASAVLVANNLRDIPSDRGAGKMTLAVRLGESHTKLLYLGLVALSVLVCVGAALLGHPFALVALLAYPLLWPAVQTLRSGAAGADLVPVLARTGITQLAWSLLLAVGIALH